MVKTAETTHERPQFDRSAFDDPSFLKLATKRQERRAGLLENDQELDKLHGEFKQFTGSYDLVQEIFSNKVSDTFNVDLNEKDQDAIKNAFMDQMGEGRLNLNEFTATANRYYENAQNKRAHLEKYDNAIASLESDKGKGKLGRAFDAVTRFMPRPFSPRANSKELSSLGVPSTFFFSTKGYDQAIDSLKGHRDVFEEGYKLEKESILNTVVGVVSKNREFLNRIKEKVVGNIQDMLGKAKGVDDVVDAREYFNSLKGAFGEEWAKKIGNEVMNEKINGHSIQTEIEEVLFAKLAAELGKNFNEAQNNLEKHGAFSEFTNGLESLLDTAGDDSWKDVKQIIESNYAALEAAKATDPKAAMKLTLLKAAVVHVQRKRNIK